jgi:hypothetical protein
LRTLLRLLVFFCVATLPAAAQKAAEPFSPASLVNKHLPTWLRFGGEQRTRLEGYSGLGYRDGQHDTYLLNRTRLSINIIPTKWAHFYGEMQDARATGKRPGQPPTENLWDFHQVFVELGSIDKSRVWLKAGRQEIVIADSRIMGAVQWSNANRTFDAVRAGYHFAGGNRIELFTASVVVNASDTWDHHQQGNNIHGIYTEFPKLLPGLNLQPYLLWRTQPNVRNEAGRIADVNEFTPGFRLAGKLPHSLDFVVEMTRETGTIGSDRIRSWMGHWEVGHTRKQWMFSPRIWAEYNYHSGDSNPTDGVRGTYDPLYAALHDKFGFADQVAGRNLRDIRGGVEAKLPHGIGAVIEINDWRLASRYDALYSSTAVVARSPSGTAGTHVGNEVDLITTWKMPGPLQGGAGIGYIIPGEFLKHTTPGKHYIYPFVVFTYKL